MQLQKEQLADERVVILGEHKKELQTLVSVMSASINRDLPARIEGMASREVCSLTHSCAIRPAASLKLARPAMRSHDVGCRSC